MHIFSSQSLQTLRQTSLLTVGLMFTLSACGGDRGGGTPIAINPPAVPVKSVSPLRIVATPNPSVLPLLLAMSRTPDLPVELLPVSNGSGIDQAFSTNHGEGLLSMTWVAASKVVSGVVPDLHLTGVYFWRGFFELMPSTGQASNFSALIGKNVLLSGPVDGGRNGGPDTLFKAALKREGFDPSVYSESEVTLTINASHVVVTRRVYPSGDFRVYYIPVMSAASVLTSNMLLDDGDGNSSNDQPAAGAFMVEPAASGIVLYAKSNGEDLRKAIDIQSTFSGYGSWSAKRLPLGGLSLKASVLNDPLRAEAIQRLNLAYSNATVEIMAAQAQPRKMAQIAQIISAGIDAHYGQYGLSLPAPALIAALKQGDLIYDNTMSVSAIQADLMAFHKELLGSIPPASFYAP